MESKDSTKRQIQDLKKGRKKEGKEKPKGKTKFTKHKDVDKSETQ